MMAKKVNNFLTKRQNTAHILKTAVPRFQYDFEVLSMIVPMLTNISILLYQNNTNLTTFKWNRGTINIRWGLKGDKWFMQGHVSKDQNSNEKNKVKEARPPNEPGKTLFELRLIDGSRGHLS